MALLQQVHQLRAFLAENKVWWLLPVAVLLALGGIVAWASRTPAPFMYTLF